MRVLFFAGRKILYSCEWPLYQMFAGLTPNYALIMENCNLVRSYHDVADAWDSVVDIIDHFGDNQATFAAVQKPGAFFDPDMIIVGKLLLQIYIAQLSTLIII